MRKERLKAATEVASLLFAVEKAVDSALCGAGTLTAAMSQARLEANLAATVGNEAFESVAAAVGAIAQARSHIVSAHLALDITKTQMGLRTLNFGTGGGKLEEQVFPRLVKTEAA